MQKKPHAHKSNKEKNEEKRAGVISTTGKGIGFVAVPGHEEDILIETKDLNTALNGDEVEIVLHPLSKGERQAGEVVKIIKRAKMKFVGIIKEGDGFFYLKPDDRKMYVDILLPSSPETKPGVKAFVRITEWNKEKRVPVGEVIETLGEKGSHEVEIRSILLEKQIDTTFPPQVEEEARQIEKREKPLPEDEIARRRDMRGTTTVTIDPKDAKDFDDAISFVDVGGGRYEIGVHIADVSHYVEEGTSLDKEALNRATSVYLVDRTIPMLPEVLSNDLCSLNPHEDKFAFSAVFTINKEGKVLERWFGKTVINSDRRFTYEDAQAVLDAKQGDFFKELEILNSVAYKLREQKRHAGAIDFDTEEVRFELDEHMKPIRVYKKARLDTHKLVEDYMLLANREVAKFIHDAKMPSGKKFISLYRIHDLPDPDRLSALSTFVRALGFNLEVKEGKVTSRALNSLLKQIEGSAHESLIKTATIRSMAKAIYSTKNIGHFGLAFEYYTHFTSPIRRYPDLIVQRVLFNILTGNAKRAQDEFAQFERIAIQSTEKEIEAAEAERASIKFKQVEFMSDKVGQIFNGTISGVTEWGIYVEESESKSEGMIRLKDMKDDYYELNEKTYSIKGQKTGKKYSLGDKVKVKLTRADLDEKTLDFALVEV